MFRLTTKYTFSWPKRDPATRFPVPSMFTSSPVSLMAFREVRNTSVRRVFRAVSRKLSPWGRCMGSNTWLWAASLS